MESNKSNDSNDSSISIGKRITELRKGKGLTQGQLAKDLNVLRQTIVQWEKGERDLKTGHTKELANYFEKTCDYIISGIDAENVDCYTKLGLSNDAVNVLSKLNKNKESNYALINTINLLIEQEVPLPSLMDDEYSAKEYEEHGKVKFIIPDAEYEQFEKDSSNWKNKNYVRVLSALANYYNISRYKCDEENRVILDDNGIYFSKDLLANIGGTTNIINSKGELLKVLMERMPVLSAKQLLEAALYIEVQKAITGLMDRIEKGGAGDK